MVAHRLDSSGTGCHGTLKLLHQELGIEMMLSVMQGSRASLLHLSDQPLVTPDVLTTVQHEQAIELPDGFGIEDWNTREAELLADDDSLISHMPADHTLGARPKGDLKWFHDGMAKHQKHQHARTPPNIYQCLFPGCNSQYKTRPDNLRQHHTVKGHFVDDQDDSTKGRKREKSLEPGQQTQLFMGSDERRSIVYHFSV